MTVTVTASSLTGCHLGGSTPPLSRPAGSGWSRPAATFRWLSRSGTTTSGRRRARRARPFPRRTTSCGGQMGWLGVHGSFSCPVRGSIKSSAWCSQHPPGAFMKHTGLCDSRSRSQTQKPSNAERPYSVRLLTLPNTGSRWCAAEGEADRAGHACIIVRAYDSAPSQRMKRRAWARSCRCADV
jgi:hypothetical protein